jgi:hypothetical protein
VTDTVPASNSRSSPPNNSIDATAEIARLAALSPFDYDLARMNERSAVVRIGGRSRVQASVDVIRDFKSVKEPIGYVAS